MSHSSSSRTQEGDAITKQNTQKVKQVPPVRTPAQVSACQEIQKIQTPNRSLTTHSFVYILRAFIREIYFSFKGLSSFPPSFNSKVKDLFYTSQIFHFTSTNRVSGFLPDQSVCYLWLSLRTVQLETLQDSVNGHASGTVIACRESNSVIIWVHYS